MKTMLIAIALFLVANAHAQDDEAVATMVSDGIKKMDQARESWDGALFAEAHAQFDKAAKLFPKSAAAAYWKGYADYRLAIYHREDALYESFLDAGISALEKSVDLDPKSSDAYALLGSLVGMKIPLDPQSGMVLGPKSNSYFQKGIQLDPSNPRAHYLKAVSKLFTPKMFGGGPEIAVPVFEEAISLYEAEASKKNTDPLKPDWGYVQCHIFLGQAFTQVKDYEQAEKHLKRALEINPESLSAKRALERFGTINGAEK